MRGSAAVVILIALLAPAALMAADVAPVVTAKPALPAVDEWRYMTFEQRHEEMTFVIHPTLAERWQAFYHTDAPKLQCVTCHGADAEQHRYQMAFTPLDDLQPSRVRDLYRSDAELNDEQRFKRDVITPLMADMLGEPHYDPATGLGFSCFGCHPREAEK